jgi:hypothetical protein
MTLNNHQKIQLWSNADKSEYAIYINDNSNAVNKKYSEEDTYSHLVVATSHNRNMKYTELIDECDYLEDLKYDWKYTLEIWIDNYKYGLNLVILSSIQQLMQHDNNNNNTSTTNSKGSCQELEGALRKEGELSAYNKINTHKNFRECTIKKRKKTNLKRCHFCKLEYLTNKERAEHEQAWHAHKIMMMMRININNNKKEVIMPQVINQ